VSWNIEIVAFNPAIKNFDHVVPDVFERTKKVVPFDEATSSSMHGNLCIGTYKDTTFLIDTGCRISGKISEISKNANGNKVHLVRVANNKKTKSFKNGKEIKGSNPLLKALGLQKQVKYSEGLDGEQKAWEYLSFHTGLNCPEDLFNSKYTVYKIEL